MNIKNKSEFIKKKTRIFTVCKKKKFNTYYSHRIGIIFRINSENNLVIFVSKRHVFPPYNVYQKLELVIRINIIAKQKRT